MGEVMLPWVEGKGRGDLQNHILPLRLVSSMLPRSILKQEHYPRNVKNAVCSSPPRASYIYDESTAVLGGVLRCGDVR